MPLTLRDYNWTKCTLLFYTLSHYYNPVELKSKSSKNHSWGGPLTLSPLENGDSDKTNGAVVKIDEREQKSKDKSQTRDHSNRDDNFDLNTEINFDGSEEIIRLPEDYADPDREPLETAYGMPFPVWGLNFLKISHFLERILMEHIHMKNS